MFGGIIRHQGRVASVDLVRGHLRIRAPGLIRFLRRGDSIAVDGVCLTVTSRARDSFSVDITPETIHRTTFRWTRPGWRVNLELPLRMSDRLHGHLVLGHVDGVGLIETAGRRPARVRTRAVPYVLIVRIPRKLTLYVPEKGSITLNGVSLTIAGHRGRVVRVALIPETLRRTNLRFLRRGSRVNVEADVLARYALARVKPRRKKWIGTSVQQLKKRSRTSAPD